MACRRSRTARAREGEPDQPAGVRQAVTWVQEHRKALTKKNPASDRRCEHQRADLHDWEGARPIDVPSATTGDAATPNCVPKEKKPSDDVIVLVNGYAALSPVPPG